MWMFEREFNFGNNFLKQQTEGVCTNSLSQITTDYNKTLFSQFNIKYDVFII